MLSNNLNFLPAEFDAHRGCMYAVPYAQPCWTPPRSYHACSGA
jgi:hypothetical protein